MVAQRRTMIKMVKSIRVKDETHIGLKALRKMTPEHDESLDDVIQKLIRFYLKKPTDSKRSGRTKGGVTS